MFNNTTKSTPKKIAAKSGLVPATLHAINPTSTLYEKITGRKLGYDVDYRPKEGKTPFRLLVSINDEFVFMDMWDLQNKVRTSSTGKTQFIDSSNGKTTWRATHAEAISELGEGCTAARIGEEDIVNMMLQYRGKILNHIIENATQFDEEVFAGNWEMFNTLIQLHKVEKQFYVFAYSKTSDSGFVNLQAMRGIFIPAWKIIDKNGNIPTWTDKDGNTVSNVSKTLLTVQESVAKSESLQKPNVFISLQFGFVTQGEETPIVSNFEIPEADADKTDDLPF